MRTHLDAKAMAKSLRAALAAKNIAVSHSECLEIVAKQFGFGEWNMLAAKIDLETGTRRPPPESPGIALHATIPVVPIASVTEATTFYLDVLGFAADWGRPTRDEQRPVYAQISRSGVTLHLREHRGDAAPPTELFIRMSGLDVLHEELSRGRPAPALEIRRTPDDRRELHVIDPFGNRLRFSENNAPGASRP